MRENIPLILIATTKTGENAIVLHTLSKEYGRRSFISRIGKKTGMSSFLPLNILDADIVSNPKSSLWSASNIVVKSPLDGIRGNLYKNTMTLFMSEVLFRTIKDGVNEDGLFEWCLKSIMTLDAIGSNFSNYHIRFLLELAGALGFSPSFDDIAPFASAGTGSNNHLKALEAFLTASFSESMIIPLTGADRKEIAEDLLRYLEFHTESTIAVRSLDVLHEVFA